MRTIQLIKTKIQKQDSQENQGVSNSKPETDLMLFEADLSKHLDTCKEVLKLLETENTILSGTGEIHWTDSIARHKALLSQLNENSAKLREHREKWLKLDPETRGKYVQISELIKQNQEVILKIIMLDRENEKLILRRGLLPPTKIPSLRPTSNSFLAALYKK